MIINELTLQFNPYVMTAATHRLYKINSSLSSTQTLDNFNTRVL